MKRIVVSLVFLSAAVFALLGSAHAQLMESTVQRALMGEESEYTLQMPRQELKFNEGVNTLMSPAAALASAQGNAAGGNSGGVSGGKHCIQPELGYAHNWHSYMFHFGADYTYFFNNFVGINGMLKFALGNARVHSGWILYADEPTSVSGTFDPNKTGTIASLISMGVGVNFHPVQIWLPDTPHILELKAGLPLMIGTNSAMGITSTRVMAGLYFSAGYVYRINQTYAVGVRLGDMVPFNHFYYYRTTFFLGFNCSIYL